MKKNILLIVLFLSVINIVYAQYVFNESWKPTIPNQHNNIVVTEQEGDCSIGDYRLRTTFEDYKNASKTDFIDSNYNWHCYTTNDVFTNNIQFVKNFGSSNYVTNGSLQVATPSVDSSNSIIAKLPQKVAISDNTNLSIKCKHGVGAQPPDVVIYFKDSTSSSNMSNFAIDLLSPTGCAITSVDKGNVYCISIQNLSRGGGYGACSCDQTSFCTYNFNIKDGLENNGIHDYAFENFNWNRGFDYVEIAVRENQNTFIDDIYLSNLVAPVENSLPSVDIIYNSTTLCINETATAVFNFDIQATDTEGDTLYYATQFGNVNYFDLSFEEDFLQDTHDTQNDCKLDFDVFTRSNYFTNHTYTTSEGTNAFWYLRLDDEQQAIIGQPTFGCNALLTTPEGVDYFGIGLENIFNGRTTSSFYVGFPYNDTYINIVPRQANNNPIFNLTLNQSSAGVLNVLIDGISYQSSAHDNFDYDNFGNTIDVAYLINATEGVVKVSISTNNGFINVQLNKTISSYSKIDFYTKDRGKSALEGVDEDYWYLARLSVYGNNFELTPTFSTTKPTKADIDFTGNKYFTIYVSDSVHQPSEYITETINLYVTADDLICKYYQDTTDKNQSSAFYNITDAGKDTTIILADLFGDLSGNKINFMNVFIWVWVIISFAFAVFIFYITFYNVGLANIGFWFCMAIGTFLFVYPSWLLYFVVVACVFSVAFYLVNKFSGNSANNGGTA